MSIAAPAPKANMGQPVPRYDGVAKVTGRAQYAADVPLANPAYAYFVSSAIAKGRIDSFDLTDAKDMRGVIDIFTHENSDKLKQIKFFSDGGYASSTIIPLNSHDIAHDGEIIAVVVADTVSVGTITRHRVPVFITAQGSLEQSLLGMNFIGTLSGFEVRGDRMILRD